MNALTKLGFLWLIFEILASLLEVVRIPPHTSFLNKSEVSFITFGQLDTVRFGSWDKFVQLWVKGRGRLQWLIGIIGNSALGKLLDFREVVLLFREPAFTLVFFEP